MSEQYYSRDGKPYNGPVCILPDGRVVSGKTYTTESRRVHTRADLPAGVSIVQETKPVAPASKDKKTK